MKKVYILIVSLVVVVVLVFGFLFYSHHNPISIILPFDTGNEPHSLIPMGETLEHPNSPLGHPGIDFKWNYSATIIASADGVVKKIENHDGEENWNVIIASRDYVIEYQELSEYNPELYKGKEIEQGSFIGHPANYIIGDNDKNYQIHWDIRPRIFGFEPYCPMNYFTEESRDRINVIWNNSGDMFKKDFPDICNGGFKDRF